MEEKISKRRQVLELIMDDGRMTAKDISTFLKIDERVVYQYLHQYEKEGKVKIVYNKGYFNVYEAISKGESDFEKYPETKKMLIFLNTFFKNNVMYLAKHKEIYDFIIQNELKFKLIEELISNEYKFSRFNKRRRGSTRRNYNQKA